MTTTFILHSVNPLNGISAPWTAAQWSTKLLSKTSLFAAQSTKCCCLSWCLCKAYLPGSGRECLQGLDRDERPFHALGYLFRPQQRSSSLLNCWRDTKLYQSEKSEKLWNHLSTSSSTSECSDTQTWAWRITFCLCSKKYFLSLTIDLKFCSI